MHDPNAVSCFIHKRTGDVEIIRGQLAGPSEVARVPTSAGLIPVRDIMTREVICVLADVPVETVIDLLVHHYIGCVPVVDEDGCPIGMLTKRDLVEPMANRVTSAEDTPRSSALAPRTAGEAMLPIVFSLDENATLARAATMMATEDLHHVPVVSANGRIIGIVSTLDIVRWLARNDGHAS